MSDQKNNVINSVLNTDIRIYVAALLVLALCVQIGAYFYNSISASEDSEDVIEQRVWKEAKSHIEFDLKSPSTAKNWSHSIMKMEEGKYTVTGHVDSQNSYGAEGRTYFNLTIEGYGDLLKVTDEYYH